MAEFPQIEIRVEAASWRNKPVYFDVIGPWTRPFRQQKFVQPVEERIQQVAGICMFAITLIAGAFFVRANLRAGRVDRRGAFRIGAFAFSATLAALILYGHHQNGMDELAFFIRAFANACFIGTVVWLIYLAVEPPVRRRWPQTMISWSRLLGGRWQDPLVGGHVLAGLAAGGILVIIADVATVANIPFGDSLNIGYLDPLLGIRHALGGIAQSMVGAPAFAMVSFFTLFLFRLVCRRDWLTAVLYVAFFSAFTMVGQEGNRLIILATALLGNTLFTIILLRFGLLANMVMMFTSYVLGQFPLTLDLGSWRGDVTLLVGTILFGAGIYTFRIALAHRKVFSEIDT
jgi:serine/threonine-protein kinase